jgi:RND family efflux transporter MFP subunit
MNLAATRASYAQTLADAGKRRVISPIDGTVNEINIKNGDDLDRNSNSSSSQPPIIIGDLGTLKAQVKVSEVDIAQVSVGQKAMLRFSSADGLDFSGKVEKVDALGSIDQGVVTYNVTIGFDALDPRIKPGMSVSSSIIKDVRQGVVTVPNSAVKTEGNTTYVEILNGSVPERRPVEIGGSNNTDTEIVSGIREGEEVVTQTIDPSAISAGGSAAQGGGLRLPGLGGAGTRNFR